MFFEAEINGIATKCSYSEANIQEIFLPLLRLWTKMQAEKQQRILILLAAPPGTGKSTMAAFLQLLAEKTPGIAPITAIGMDGFHRYQDYLCSHTVIRDGIEIPMVQIKGAPITFDLPLLKASIQRIASGENLGWPTYNRMTHNPQENAIQVVGNIVLLEGNYLLLQDDGWNELCRYADFTVSLMPEIEDVRERLIARKIASGTPQKEAEAFVERSDLYNARLCLARTKPADCMMKMLSDGTFRLLTPPIEA